VPERHRSMQATLEASWRRLSSDQQIGFQELCVFRGGFIRSAAYEVADVTLPLLVTLVNKSWLSYDRERDRYNVHELLRQYGAGKLRSDSTHEKEVRERFNAYFCGYLKEREADWFGARQKEAASEVCDEADNIQNAWRWAADHGNLKLLSQGLDSLCRFYLWEGRMIEGGKACRSAAEGLSRSLAAQQTEVPERLTLWSQVLAWESEFTLEISHRKNLLEQSQSILDQVSPTNWDKRSQQAFIFLEKALSTGNMSINEAIRFNKLSLELYQEIGDYLGEAKVLELLGGNYVFRGESDLATDLLHESLEIRRQLNDKQGIAQTTVYLGFAAKFQGCFEKAESLQRKSLDLFQQIGNRWSERMCLSVLSHTLTWAGKFDAARETAGRALELDRDLGQFPNPASLNPMSAATLHLGHTSESMTTATKSLAAARQRGHLVLASWALMLRGSIGLTDGDLAAAKRDLLEAAELMEEGRIMYHAIPKAILCYVVRAQEDGNLAREYMAYALLSGVESSSILPIMYCLPAAALLAADADHIERAIELYSLANQYGHIANSRWFEDIASRELEDVLASLPPAVASEASVRGRELDVWTTADQLLLDLASC